MPGEKREHSFDEALARLDCGYKQLRYGQLYLAQEAGTVMGAVAFDVGENGIIVGPDGRSFDLNNM